MNNQLVIAFATLTVTALLSLDCNGAASVRRASLSNSRTNQRPGLGSSVIRSLSEKPADDEPKEISTNTIASARAKAREHFITHHPDYLGITARAEEKYQLNLVTNKWKAGCGKGVILDLYCGAAVFSEDGRLLEFARGRVMGGRGGRNNLEVYQYILSEQQNTRSNLLATLTAEISACEDEGEQIARQLFAQDQERKAEEKAAREKQEAEEKAAREKQEAEEKAAREKQEAEEAAKFDTALDDLFGLKFGMSTNDLKLVKGKCPPFGYYCPICELPKPFRHITEAYCEHLNGVVYKFILYIPFRADQYSSESIKKEFDTSRSEIETALGKSNHDRQYTRGGKCYETQRYSDGGSFEFVDLNLRDRLQKEIDAKKPNIPDLPQ